MDRCGGGGELDVSSDGEADPAGPHHAAAAAAECPDEGASQHPARRPMNAFLLFCKKHRRQVREKYPHLENRQVTKILGEWWADLDANEKTGYQELARQLKEAFLRANPDFKWYKIPSQPPRPPPARPSNQKVPRHQPNPTSTSAITFGKLADENLMGRLSTLLSPVPSSTAPHTSDLLLSTSPPPPHCQLVTRDASVYDRPVSPDKSSCVEAPHTNEALTLNLTHATVIHVSSPHHPALWRHASASNSLPYSHLKSGAAPEQVFLYETSESDKVDLAAGGEESRWSPDCPEFAKPLAAPRSAAAKSEERTALYSQSVSSKVTQKSNSEVILLEGSGSTVLRVPSFSCGGLSPAIDESAIAHKEDIAVNALSALACSSFVIPPDGQPQDAKRYSSAQAASLSNSSVSVEPPSYVCTGSPRAGTDYITNNGPRATSPISGSNSAFCNGAVTASGLSRVGQCVATRAFSPSMSNWSGANTSAMTETPTDSAPAYSANSAAATHRFRPAVNGNAPRLSSGSSVSWAGGGSGRASEAPQLKCSLAFTSANFISTAGSSSPSFISSSSGSPSFISSAASSGSCSPSFISSASPSSGSPSYSSISSVSIPSPVSLAPTAPPPEAKKPVVAPVTAHMTPPKPPKKRYLHETMHRPPASPPLVDSPSSSNNNNNNFNKNETDAKRIKLSHWSEPPPSSGNFEVAERVTASPAESGINSGSFSNCTSNSSNCSSNSVSSSLSPSPHYARCSVEASSRPNSLPFYHDSYQNSPVHYFVPSRRASECSVTHAGSTFAEQQQQQPLNLTHSPLASQSPSPVLTASRSALPLACVSPSSSVLSSSSPPVTPGDRYSYAIEVPVAERYPHITEVRIGAKYSDTTASDQPLNLIMASCHDPVQSCQGSEQRRSREKEEQFEGRIPWHENNDARHLNVAQRNHGATNHQENNAGYQERSELQQNKEQRNEHENNELQIVNTTRREVARGESESLGSKEAQGKPQELSAKKQELHEKKKEPSDKRSGPDKKERSSQQSDVPNQTFINLIVDSMFHAPHKAKLASLQNAFSSPDKDNDSQRAVISSASTALPTDHHSSPQLKRQHPPKTYSHNKSCGGAKAYPGGFPARATRHPHAEAGSASYPGQAAVVGSSADSSVKLLLMPSLSSQSPEQPAPRKTVLLTEDESPPQESESRSDTRSSASCPASSVVALPDPDAQARQSPVSSISNASATSFSMSHNKKTVRGRTYKDKIQSDNRSSPESIAADKILPDRNSQRTMLISKTNNPKAKFSRRNALPNDSSRHAAPNAISANSRDNVELERSSVSSPVSAAPSEVPAASSASGDGGASGEQTQAGTRNSTSRPPTAPTLQPTPEQHRRIIDQAIINSINRNTIDKEKEDRDFELFCKSKRAVELGVVVGSRAASNSALSAIVTPKSTPNDKNAIPRINQHNGNKNAIKTNFSNSNEPQVPNSPKLTDAVRTIASSLSRGNNSVRTVDFSDRSEGVNVTSGAEAVPGSGCGARSFVSPSPPHSDGTSASSSSAPHSSDGRAAKHENSAPPELGKKRKSAPSAAAKKVRRGGWPGRGGEAGSRASRACKGKRYQELMDEGVLQSGRRTRARAAAGVQAGRNDEDYKDEDGTEEPRLPEEQGGISPPHLASEADTQPHDHQEDLAASHPECHSPSSYFDLEAKIEALPYLSLDDFTRRKKENKKKASSSSSTGPLPARGSEAGGGTDSPLREDAAAASATLEGVASSSKVSNSSSSTIRPEPSLSNSSDKALLPPRSGGILYHHPTSTHGTNSALPSTLHNSNNNLATDAGPKHASSDSKGSSTKGSSTLVWSCSVQSSSNSSTSVSSSSLTSNNNNSSSNSSSSSSSSECCEDCDQTPLTGSQRRKARKQTITRHDPLSSTTNLKAAVVDPGVLSSMGLQTLADAALEQHSMKT